MKTTVITDELRLSDVRPTGISGRYLELRREETHQLLENPDVCWQGRKFPGAKDQFTSIFVADGLCYHMSEDCGSLFASPVPSQDVLDKLHREGAANAFRREHFARQFSEKQRQSVNAPFVRWLRELIEGNLLEKPDFAMVGDDDTGALNSIEEKLDMSSLTAIGRISGQPTSENVNNVAIEDAPDAAFDIVLDNGSLERVAEPCKRIDLWMRILRPGGFLAFTTNTASGLEYRLLGPNAPSFAPLDRLTLYSMPGLRKALESRGFHVVEMSTPGRVDVELLSNYFEENAKDDQLKFWPHALKFASAEMKADLQNFLQRHRLCSFARVVVQKPKP